jgi:REP element-mobilizing transposase RayT
VEGDYHRRFSAQLDRWLDEGHGSCILRSQKCATIVAAALRHFDDKRYLLLASVIMPNHVHVLFVQNPGATLESLLRTWKTFTARQINRMAARRGILWQRDYFDRLVRDRSHLSLCVRYIRNNPVKARRIYTLREPPHQGIRMTKSRSGGFPAADCKNGGQPPLLGHQFLIHWAWSAAEFVVVPAVLHKSKVGL